MDHLQVVQEEGTYMGGKFLLGNSETMGHRGYLANMPLPEALMFNILDSNLTEVSSSDLPEAGFSESLEQEMG